MFEISPVFIAHKRMKRRYVIDGDMRQSDIQNVIRDAVEYATDLLDDKIPFVVRESDNVTSGKVWLSKHAN